MMGIQVVYLLVGLSRWIGHDWVIVKIFALKTISPFLKVQIHSWVLSWRGGSPVFCNTSVKLLGFSFVLVQGLLTALLSLFFLGFGMNQFLSEGFAGTEGHYHVMLGQTIILCFSVKVRHFLRILWITWEQGGIVFWNQYHRWIY